MSEAFWTAFISAMSSGVPATLMAAATLVYAFKGRRAVSKLSNQVNGRLEQFIQALQRASHAEGHAEGVSLERNRRHDDPPNLGRDPKSALEVKHNRRRGDPK